MAKKPGGYARGLSKGWGQYWPGVAIVEDGPKGPYLLRPGQLLADPEDAARVRDALKEDWVDHQPVRDAEEGIVLFRLRKHPDVLRQDAGQRTVDTVEGLRADGLRVSPNHVLPGQQLGANPAAIVFAGCPRLMGGPGTLVDPAPEPTELSELGRADGQDVRVAVLDTGVWREHPWLGPRLSQAVAGDQTAAETGWDVDADGILDAEAGHGTFIAGLILQVATGADVVPRRVLSSQGVGDDAEIADAIAALPDDISVINLSLGGYTDNDEAPMALARELRRRTDNGVVVVAAAGNAGSDRVFWPAALGDVVGVAALDDGALASFSNHGEWVTACAPGVDLVSCFFAAQTFIGDGAGHVTSHPQVTFDGWARWSGTSMAAPLVAAGVAVLMRDGVSAQDALARLLSDEFSDPASGGADLPNARCLNFQRLREARRDMGPI